MEVHFLGVRRFKRFCEAAKPFTGGTAIIIMASAIVIVISKIKDLFFSEPSVVIVAACLAFGFYLMLYIAGWFIFSKKPLDERITYTFITGNNNIMLALTLALLFFPRQEVVMLAFGEFAWISGVALFQIFLKHHRKSKGIADA